MHLLRGVAVERRMMATGAVEREEMCGFPLDGGEIGQVRIIPDVAIVLLMEAFDVAIALRMLHRREERFGTDRQAKRTNCPRTCGCVWPPSKQLSLSNWV